MFKHIAGSDLVITTYALLRRDLEEMEKYEFNTVILDEAQNSKIPTPSRPAPCAGSTPACGIVPLGHAH